MNFKLIKRGIEYAERLFAGKRQRYAITTNGSLLSLSIVEYLAEKNVSLTVSLDGPQNIHDRNRKFGVDGSGTFFSVYNNLQRIREAFPDYYKKIKFNSVIDPFNDASAIDAFFYKDLFVQNFVNTPLVRLDDSEKLVFPPRFLHEYNKDKFLALLSMSGECSSLEIPKIAHTFYEALVKFKRCGAFR